MGRVGGAPPGAIDNSSAIARLAAQQTLGVADTMTDVTGVSVALEPGTWWLIGQALIRRPAGADGYAIIEITTAANVAVAGGRAFVSANTMREITAAEIVTPAVTTTYKLRARAALATPTIEVHDNIDANARATRLVAVRLV